MKNINDILIDVSSPYDTIKMQAIDNALNISNKISDAVIFALKQSADSIFIAEKLSAHINNIYAELNKVFFTSEDKTKLNIALIFLTNDNFTHNDFILKFASETKNPSDAALCLSKLSSKGIIAAKPVIRQWINNINADQEFLSDMKKKIFYKAYTTH